MTSCINMACGFATYPDGLVFVCRVKPGIMLGFEEEVPDYEGLKEGQDSNVNFIANEYVIYDKTRILPIAMIEDVTYIAKTN